MAYHVLLVEEREPDIRRLREDLACGDPRLVVTPVATLAAARAAVACLPVDCILLNVSLPDRHALGAVAALSSTDGPGLVVLTPGETDAVALGALALGADEHLTAGCPPEVLVRAVRHTVERRAGRRLLCQQDALFGWAVESLREGVVVYDSDGRIAHHNGAARRILGFAPRSVQQLRAAGSSPYVRPDGTPLPLEEHPSRVAFETGRPVVGATVGLRLPDGETRWLLVNAIPAGRHEGLSGIGTVVSFEDVTARQRAVQALENITLRDPLTGLTNRALLLDRLGQSLERAMARGANVAMVLVDVDGFNSLNDGYGFAAGDDLLADLAGRLQRRVPAATVGRLSADTFGVILESAGDPDDVVAAAHGLREAATGRCTVGEADVYVSCSAGVALGPPGAAAEQLLRNADLALHRAKAAGGGRTVVYEDGDLASARDRLELERDLRLAIARGGLTIEYQPIVRISDHTVVGAEALARWHHPTRGPIAPASFVEMATTLGLVRQLTRQMLEGACHQVAAWRAGGVIGPGFRVAVNLTAADLADPGLPGEVHEILERAGLDAGCLTLEVTETGLVQDTDTALAALYAVRRLGAHVSIDDFGTGYSSLSYLRRFPIDKVKIDKSFVQGLGHDPDATTLARGIVSLASGLGLQTIAEGIENDVQLQALVQLGCPLAQGYLWSEPVPPERFADRIREIASTPVVGAPSDVTQVVLGSRGDGIAWAALDSLRAPLAVLDMDGTILATNLSWQRFTLDNGGRAADCGPGVNYLGVCERARGQGADGAAQAALGIRAVLAGRAERFELEYDCSAPGTLRRFQLFASPLSGRTGMAVVAHLDITDRHRAELALAESHHRHQSLVDQAPVGVLRVGPDGLTLDANPPLCTIVGRPPSDMQGMASAAPLAPEEAGET